MGPDVVPNKEVAVLYALASKVVKKGSITHEIAHIYNIPVLLKPN